MFEKRNKKFGVRTRIAKEHLYKYTNLLLSPIYELKKKLSEKH